MKRTIILFIKRMVVYFLYTVCPIKKKKMCFLITQYHSDNCIQMLHYLMDVCPQYTMELITDHPSYARYRDLFDGTDVQIIDRDREKFKAWHDRFTSRYVFYMHERPFLGVKPRNGQMVVNLWHGAGYKGEQKVKKQERLKDGEFDLVLVPGPLFIKPKAELFHCHEKRVKPIGYPRYDIMLNPNPRGEELRREFLNHESEKLIIWMPTFRKCHLSQLNFAESTIETGFPLPLFRSLDELLCLDSFCAEKQVAILIKKHPYQTEYGLDHKSFRNIIFIDDNDFRREGIGLYDLLPSTDALITDYSSVAVDYLLLDRPIAFILDDYEQYKATRGFAFENPEEYMPGDHVFSLTDLKKFITDITENRDRYKNERARLIKEMQNPCTQYCKRIWETVQTVDQGKSAKNGRKRCTVFEQRKQ